MKLTKACIAPAAGTLPFLLRLDMDRHIATILAALVCAGCGRQVPEVSIPAAAESLPALTRGSGPEVVLVHGVLGDYRIWEGVTRELDARYRLTAISRRYHWPRLGTPATGEYTYERQAEDLATVLLQLDGRVHLVGHSYGAGVALLTALRYPERIRSLVLIEPPFGSVVPMSENRFKPELASRDSLVRVIRSDAATGAHRRAAETLFDWVQGGVGGFRALPQRTRDQILENASTIGPTFATASTRVTCDDLRALDVPVLVVTGQTTRPWYELIAFHTSACVPLAERATVPRASHMVIVERPAATAAVLARFFDAH